MWSTGQLWLASNTSPAHCLNVAQRSPRAVCVLQPGEEAVVTGCWAGKLAEQRDRPSGCRDSFLVIPSLLARGGSQRLAALHTFGWQVDRSQATSDNCTAAVALRTAFLFFLGVENSEDGFIKNRFETLLRQGGTFQVALCSNLKHKERVVSVNPLPCQVPRSACPPPPTACF